MEADDGLYVGAAPRELVHRSPAEAVSDRCDAMPVDTGPRGEHPEARLGDSAPASQISGELLDASHSVAHGLAPAPKVEGERDVAQIREAACLLFGVLAEAAGIVNDEDSRL